MTQPISSTSDVDTARLHRHGGLADDLLPLQRLGDAVWRQDLQRQYLAAQPYPHISIDGLFDQHVLDQVLATFPDLGGLSIEYQNKREVKRATGHELEIPPFTRAFIRALNAAPFIEFLEAITGITGLIPDPHLEGGGLHVLPRGGKLALHTDFNYNQRLKLNRRLNVLVYLNKDWRAEYGGEFQAWRRQDKQAQASYLPLFNRMVIFNTNDHTFHGNPDPVNCPEGWLRRSIALYYYTNGRPAQEWSGLKAGTEFMNRPGEDVVEGKRRGPLRTQLRRLRHWFRGPRHDG